MSNQPENDKHGKVLIDSSTEALSQDEFESRLGDEIQEAKAILAGDSSDEENAQDLSWQNAAAIVEKVKPVPWLFWVQIRSVYGNNSSGAEISPQAFSNVTGLIVKAAADSNLRRIDAEIGENPTLTQAVEGLGVEVAATVCLMHAVCRRVATGVNERVWRPIIDDALLRASIGNVVGDYAMKFSAGKGMLAGFAGRCGLAVQIASGSLNDAQQALSGLASGVEIGQVCRDVYGCDPLQVTALSLIAGGCSRDIAMGIAAYNSSHNKVQSGTEQYLWLTLFGVIEKIRMGSQDEVSDEEWTLLDIAQAERDEIRKRVKKIQRRGHGMRWITESAVQEDSPPRSPEEIRASRSKGTESS